MTSDTTGNSSGMTSSQPYLIRAIFEWIVANELTPYLMVDATKRGTVVPEEYLDELGRIILNISSKATTGLMITNDEVTFSARFSGQSMSIVVPTYSVRAIYARENGQGMMFDESSEPPQNGSKKRATLEAVVQSDNTVDSSAETQALDTAAKSSKTDSEQPVSSKDNPLEEKPVEDISGNDKSGTGKKGKKGKKGGSHLKVVK